ncbi:MAG: ACT domain-containing protein, partial [Tetragenococcus koreensis]
SNFDYIRQELDKTGQQLGIKISIQNEEIFNAMHKLG